MVRWLQHWCAPTQELGASSLAADVTVTGAICAARPLTLHGRIEGFVTGTTVVLRAGAQLYGTITADHAVICGHVEGNIRARKVHLARTAFVRGDITHEDPVAIDPGADFVGEIRQNVSIAPASFVRALSPEPISPAGTIASVQANDDAMRGPAAA